MFEAAGDHVAAAYLDYRIGIVLLHQGRRREALDLWHSSLRDLERAGDEIGALQVRGDLGWNAMRRGEYERGRELLAASLESARRAGWDWWESQNLLKLADGDIASGRIDDAERWARECLPVCVRMGNQQFTRHALAILARTAAMRGDRQRAIALWTTVEAIEAPAGRFGAFDMSLYAAQIPAGPRPAPLPLEDAVTLALAP